LTLAEIDARLAALKALPPGVLTSTFGGRTTTFSSMEDIAAEISRLEAERAVLVGESERRPRLWRVIGSKGV
jgi:hypothetical protein